jgi:hypothetical protein
MSKLTRDELIAKYDMNNPPDPNNPTVQAIVDDGPRLVAESFNWRLGSDLNELFDPTRCPEMYAVARRAHAQLRAAMADGTVEYVDASADPYDPDDVDDAAMLVHFVGSPGLCVARADSVEMFAAMYKATWQVSARRTRPARFAVKIAPVCDTVDVGGRSNFGRTNAGSSC